MGNSRRGGFSLIEILVAVGLVGIIFGGIFLAYSSVLDVIMNSDLRSAAVAVLNRQIETIRNLPFDKVGVMGGFPPGVIPFEQSVKRGPYEFMLRATIRNIDDPFDGTLGGVPNDTAPADYKLVELEISCPKCARFTPLAVTTTVAPKNLESTGSSGSLFINVIDAFGMPLSGKQVRIVNTSVVPTIDITDTTNLGGVLQLVGVPTSTQGYEITVANPGYSTDRTYTPGAPENPNPLKPHATVAAGALTNISFVVDRVSVLNIRSSDAMCSSTAGAPFSFSGSKLIGTEPNVLKFSTSSMTNSSGFKTFTNIEWDNYSFTFNATSSYLRGTNPLVPLNISPSSSVDLLLVTAPQNPNALLVTAKNSAGEGIAGASIKLSKPGFSQTFITGRDKFQDTDWSGGKYSSKSAELDADSDPGTIKMLADASSTYNTETTEWLISRTFDVGSSTSNFYDIVWTPAAQPPQTGPESILFQVASNNDNSTWVFVGPDGTANSYYSVSGQSLSAIHNGKRYFRFKVYLKTADENFTPRLEDLRVGFSSVCVPPYQVLFENLTADTYDIYATAVGYADATSTVSVGSGFQAADIVFFSP